MSPVPGRLGLIAGGGDLPLQIARHCVETGRPLFVVRLRGFADPSMDAFPGEVVGLAEVGRCIRVLKAAGCEAVCLAGNVARPDFAALKPDLRGMAMLPRLVLEARRGDDALLRAVLDEFRKEGFAIEGAHEVRSDLVLGAGVLGRHAPDAAHQADIRRALEIARRIGELDIGQGAVVCDGLVLAVEAQEGTDAMLRRVAEEVAPALRGEAGRRRGVLAKAPKPIQETRVDLPTIGPATVRGAARAGLAGLVGEAGRTLVLDREGLVALADELGLFVLGVEAP
ncbi:MAG: UDP-2,3-diacylglucosamine diphosphatase LpxI [Phenylobacterium sp.]|uniref:UDP-2,3-diacylglucosamine diphosphatase n=1 Tax=Phenylobacterium sp. TaxID=1871053 RepID=UPI0025DFDD2A|nr:UDP-2,3-diacylglucosamine diphosphatase LpxI [Phenylobacterium sp.]MCA3722381.1 UDP-2,3-diacylglucosamine diphosphatase LpxI [Phenylobacterium sp.]MCA3726118.1 UDP-2,3-diacylglucosamine diphosphatase LpxI [Phenylobacterium sp.]MCA3731550.1 UDP-2,3-diacylglucosamine diphosphatase LpxI [Phenylobacterium sp.]MCA3738554.1 UDP-2,3-diacylglucosamine diphosphatase LpxI [Phenylobacterium sp.]MCA3754364.1 UDP-2,3-diacylglucosamine diphosphatase LpxI [Phenylobacterium sp.]